MYKKQIVTVLFSIFLLSGISVLVQSISAEELLIPDWIRFVATQWSGVKDSDHEFLVGIQYLVSSNVINVNSWEYMTDSYQTPSWTRDIAWWWAYGEISDDDFINSMQYLINQGIIRL